MSEADEIPWGELGEPWWREAATKLGVSEQQMKMAACRLAGINRTRAAKLAGYKADTDEQARKNGSDAARTKGVIDLLALATAELQDLGVKPSPQGIVSEEEIDLKLSEMVRGHDPAQSLRAAELISKRRRDDSGTLSMNDHDGYADWRIVREYVRLPNGAAVIALLYLGQGLTLSAMPLLHDVALKAEREAPDVWALAVKSLSTVERAQLDKHLSDPDWQREAREKLWREIGMEIGAEGAAPLAPDANAVRQTAATSINGQAVQVPAMAGARA